ncbi:hypothetical protein DSL92_07135 [Billgrantia gudaonensis]|uniref:Nitroreductase domain-containing protein n=1 Tax=Billgrantia gudaonensis TaxID=376427 RepID=A0A432JGU5_9GAMM|nr:hypothetical protein DSL92_07135 [Halomonas gudaonensis]
MPLVLALGNIYRTLRWPEGSSPVFLAASMMFGGAVTLFPSRCRSNPASSRLCSPRNRRAAAAGGVAVFAVLYLFFFVLQRLAGPVYLGQIGSVAAVVGTLIAIFALGEAPAANLGLAALLVAGVLAVPARRPPRVHHKRYANRHILPDLEESSMKLIEALSWRYATKRMTGAKVPAERVERILEAVRLAPSSYGLQPYSVLVIEDPALRERIGQWPSTSRRSSSHRTCWSSPPGIPSRLATSTNCPVDCRDTRIETSELDAYGATIKEHS